MSDMCSSRGVPGHGRRCGERVFVRRQGAAVASWWIFYARARGDATVEAAAAVCARARDTGSRVGSLSLGAVCL